MLLYIIICYYILYVIIYYILLYMLFTKITEILVLQMSVVHRVLEHFELNILNYVKSLEL